MKKPILMAVLLTVISTVSFAFSTKGTTALSNTTKFQVVENTDSRYDLYYVSENIDNVVVRILDEKGNLINTDKLSSVKAFKRTYNLKGLPTGNYKIEVKNGEGKASQAIFHNPAVTKNLHSIVGQLPAINKFKVYVAPSVENKKVNVQIVDDKGTELISDSISAKQGFFKVYDLSQIKANYVTFKISNGKESTSFSRDLK